MLEKLQKILARSGYGSRRKIEALITQQRIIVNGKMAMIGDRFDIENIDTLSIDNQPLSLTMAKQQKDKVRTILYHKPEGELCSSSSEEGRPTVFQHLPKLVTARWVMVGRLDLNTSGVLLFTTDGEMAHRLMHPSYHIVREYQVRIFGEVTPEQLQQLQKGVQLEDGMAAFQSLKFLGGEGINRWYTVTLTEGRKREVRRIWEAVGVKVSRLIRSRYGNIFLSRWLKRGRWEELALDQINELRKSVELPVLKPIITSAQKNIYSRKTNGKRPMPLRARPLHTKRSSKS